MGKEIECDQNEVYGKTFYIKIIRVYNNIFSEENNVSNRRFQKTII